MLLTKIINKSIRSRSIYNLSTIYRIESRTRIVKTRYIYIDIVFVSTVVRTIRTEKLERNETN